MTCMIVRRTLLPALLLVAPGLAAKAKVQARRVVNLPARPVEAPFSDAVVVGDTIYLAGRIGLDPGTGKPPEDVEAEVRLLLDGIRSALAAAGAAMDDLVQVQVFCSDIALYARFNAVYRTYFGKEYPARAFVGSGPLLFGARFEMLGIAVRPAK